MKFKGGTIEWANDSFDATLDEIHCARESNVERILNTANAGFVSVDPNNKGVTLDEYPCTLVCMSATEGRLDSDQFEIDIDKPEESLKWILQRLEWELESFPKEKEITITCFDNPYFFADDEMKELNQSENFEFFVGRSFNLDEPDVLVWRRDSNED